LLAVILTWHLTGTLDFTPGGILDGKIEGPAVYVLLALFAFGTGKAALMPFHKWLPAAMVAPTPVSALLHAVAVVKAGVFTILKVVVYIFGIDFLRDGNYSEWLCWVAAWTLIVSAMIALTKNNLKARLAYSTISQLAYIVLGAAIATDASVMGGGLHIAMHAMGKITLFFCAGSIIVFAHKTEISTMDGLGRRMPWTMAAFFLGSLSIIGLPPTGGSWSKWYLALGAGDVGQPIFIAVLMLSSLLSIGYLMPIVGRAFFLPPKPYVDEHGHHHEAQTEYKEGSPLCTVPLCLTALGCVALFFWGGALRELLLPMLELR
jgi:multicomponent Na+:H+ antiporter subunit D